MKYLTSEEVAEKKGLSIRRIQQMCRDGGFDGAYKEGKSVSTKDFPTTN